MHFQICEIWHCELDYQILPEQEPEPEPDYYHDYAYLFIGIISSILLVFLIILIGVCILKKRARDREYEILAKFNQEIEMTSILKNI